MPNLSSDCPLDKGALPVGFSHGPYCGVGRSRPAQRPRAGAPRRFDTADATTTVAVSAGVAGGPLKQQPVSNLQAPPGGVLIRRAWGSSRVATTTSIGCIAMTRPRSPSPRMGCARSPASRILTLPPRWKPGCPPRANLESPRGNGPVHYAMLVDLAATLASLWTARMGPVYR